MSTDFALTDPAPSWLTALYPNWDWTAPFTLPTGQVIPVWRLVGAGPELYGGTVNPVYGLPLPSPQSGGGGPS